MFQADVFDSGHYGLFQEARPTPLREAVPELPRREAPRAVKPPKPSVAKREVEPTEATVEETAVVVRPRKKPKVRPSHTADSVLAETAIPERKPSNTIDLSQDPTARLQKIIRKSKNK
jgi:outer membrane biosynthesis protein TonB